MPPGKTARPHLHLHCESIIFILEGWCAALAGPNLDITYLGPGDFLFVSNDIVHFGINLSKKDRVLIVEIRSEKDFNKDLVLATDYFSKVPALVEKLQTQFEKGELPLPKGWQNTIGKPFSFDESKIKSKLVSSNTLEETT